ncbi:AraC family transcriptional regulator [Paenibacillus radicis (ex Xue et al. 2023)]|uniref:AraC family transcriptional regulator n=1 Tax=Paenibacillus radicis (ex Xue et al. 2023) TaxID=2972489 RepID=A0ABT1YU46_9BACL|nr:AraC family transcriptional regulator [Paenibacillus radicis (ex Xue et al. 2023)]MCR8636522.1 AraC family transcriptional regulator [Paenibacillus radicis (ex Xue et al. 2023)]
MTTISLELTIISLTIFQLTDINTYILDKKPSVLIAHVHDPLPEFLSDVQQQDFAALSQKSEPESKLCYLYTNPWGLTYLSRLMRKDEAQLMIIGPFLMQFPDNSNLKIDQKEHIQLEDFYRGLKLISGSKIQSIANILDQAGFIQQATVQVVDNPQQESNSASTKNGLELIQAQPDETFIDIIDVRYQIEKEMMQAVAQGDKAMLRSIHTKVKNLFDFHERFPNQPVRAMKNALVILNTLFRVAAEKGKVQPYFLHQISERFAKKIERCETIHSLNSLMAVMSDDYCDLVSSHTTSGYSQVVHKAAEYITLHFNKPLNLKNLSRTCHVHPAHLSRQFKKETGMTLTEFQQRQRIKEAKLLLSKNHASIAWIAGYVGFDDAGFFTRIFKKLEGMTPTEYRNS